MHLTLCCFVLGTLQLLWRVKIDEELPALLQGRGRSRRCLLAEQRGA